MSIAGILSSGFFTPGTSQTGASRFQQISSEFQQLGQDLESGNLTQAQQDFATLQQNLPGQSQRNGANNNPIAEEIAALNNDLQAGNLTAAQQDFATLQQDLQQAGYGVHHHHHHFGGAGAQSGLSNQNEAIAQEFAQLGQALQSGNLASAQQAYTTLQQDFQQYVPSFGSGSSGISSPGTTTSITV